MYLLRDQFTAEIAAGSLDGTYTTPELGLRDVTDVETVIFTDDGRLRGGGQLTPVWGESRVIWTHADSSGIVRAAGRALAAVLLPEDHTAAANFAFGFASAVGAGPHDDGFGVAMDDGGEVEIVLSPATFTLWATDSNILSMQYLIVLVLNDVGGAILISTFGNDDRTIRRTSFSVPQYPQARLLWLDHAGTTDPLFPSIAYEGEIAGGYPNGNSLEDMRVLDVAAWAGADGLADFADRFTRADSALEIGNSWTAQSGTWGITGNTAYLAAVGANGDYFATHGTGASDGDGVFQWLVTMPDVEVPAFLLVYRYQDANNYFAIRNATAAGAYLRTRLSLIKVVAGVTTNIGTLAVADWAAGTTYRFAAYVEGGRHVIVYDNTVNSFLDFSGHDDLDTVATMGVGINANGTAGRYGVAGTKFDNVGCWPHLVTLPSEFSDGKVPAVLTPGAIISSDDLSGTAGNPVAGTTDDQGHTWAMDAATGNTWVFTADGTVSPGVPEDIDPDVYRYSHLLVDLGVTDAEISVDLHVPTLAQFTEPTDPIIDPDHDPVRAGIDGYRNSMLVGLVGRYENATAMTGIHAHRVHYTPYTNEAEMFSGANVPHKSQLGDYYEPGTTIRLKMQFKGDEIFCFCDDVPTVSYYRALATDGYGTKFGLRVAYRGMRYVEFSNWEARAL